MAKKSKKELALSNLKGFVSAEGIMPDRLIPTGHPDLDYVLSASIVEERKELKEKGVVSDYHKEEAGGGFPSGKLVMIYGGEGSGKSSIAYRVCAKGQNQGLLSAWFDVEHSFSSDLAKINGLDTKGDFILKETSEEYYAEAILDDIIETAKCKEIDIIVLDSIAALVPKEVNDNNTEKDTMALLPRILSKSLGKIAHAAAENNVLVIFINQLRKDLTVRFGNPDSCPGGHALSHFCSVICKMQKKRGKDAFIYVEDDNGENVRIAGKSYIYVEKNRFAEPHTESLIIPVYYKPYQPSIEDNVFDFGRQLKIISVRKGIFKWNDLKKDGRIGFMELIKETGLMSKLINEIKKEAKSNSITIPLSLCDYKEDISKINVKKSKAEVASINNNKL